MNYFVVHAQSNIIYSVIASSQVPTNTETTKFVLATDGRLNQYYARTKWDIPIDLYSIIAKPKSPETLPLSFEDRIALRKYVAEHRHKQTTERIAFTWRVSERTIRSIVEALEQGTPPPPDTTLHPWGEVAA